MATAIASGGDGQAAVAEATATAFCQGGGTATAWAQAYAVALSQNSQGCLVLSQAKVRFRSSVGTSGVSLQCHGGSSFVSPDACWNILL